MPSLTRRLLVVLPPALAACTATPEPPTLFRTCELSVRFDPGALRGLPRLEYWTASGSGERVLEGGAPPYAATLPLPPGPVRYRITLGQQHFTDPQNPLTDLTPGGDEVSYLDVPDCVQGVFTLAGRTDLAGGVRFSLRLLRARSGAALDLDRVVARLDGRPVEPVATWADALTFEQGGLGRGKHHFSVSAVDAGGQAVEPFNAPFFVGETDAEADFRWEDGLVYQVMTDRFAGDTPFPPSADGVPTGRRLGGNLRGLLRVVESGYFESLGVNTLWISPLYDNPEVLRVGREGGAPKYVGYHGYWPAADRAVEPAFGSEADVDALVSAAHARGLRVVMDAVLNHMDITHPAVTAHPEWFRQPACICGNAQCPWSTHIETCWFMPYLPDVDWRAPGALAHQLDTSLWWMERFDLDGLRLDAVPMMPRLVTRRLVDRVSRRFEGLHERQLLLGETYTGGGGQDLIRWYLGPHGLDSQFDFPVMWTLRDALAHDSAPLSRLAETLTASAEAWYASTAIMAIMVGNHDVPRFAETVDAGNAEPLQRLRMAHAAVLTLPGLPVIFYGDEIGLRGGEDPANRGPMRFADRWTADERALQADVSRLGRLRRCLPALRRGGLTIESSDADTLVWRRDTGDDRPALTILNRAATPATLTVAGPGGADRADWAAAFGTAVVQPVDGGDVSIVVPPQSATVLLQANDPCRTEM